MVKGFTENYKTLIKEIKEVTNKWKDILCSWIGKINIVKISISNQQTQCNPYQNPNGIFYRNSKNNPKIHMEPQSPQIPKTISRKKSKGGVITLPHFKLQIYSN